MHRDKAGLSLVTGLITMFMGRTERADIFSALA
jgi:hypothetical protein